MKLQRTSIALAAIAVLGAAPLGAQAAPTVSFSAPQSGATITQTSQCEVNGQRIERVVFSLRRSGTSTWTPLTSDTYAPWRCTIDPSKFATGQYTLRAIAYDRNTGGTSATATRTINISRTQSNTAPSVSFKAPSNGTVLPSGGGLSICEATASDSNGIAKVDFFMNGTLFRTEGGAPYTCEFASGRFPNGAYTLKAVATDKLGATSSAQVSLTIGSTAPANKAPSVSITRPVAGATLTAPASGSACEATASDSDGTVARVAFTLRNSSGASTAVGTPTAAPYQCAINTANFANGSYTLVAVATDNAGATTTTQQSLTINKTVSGDGGGTSSIAAADIITRASADMPFSQQGGYTAQVINTYTAASEVPESGIHGAMLPDGETLRLGKTVDPTDSLRRALAFQVRNSDPMTSNGKRAELSVSPNIEMNKTYWITFSAFIEDWGTLATGDQALFGTQMHTGDNGAGVGGPSFGIYTTQNGRTFRVQGRYSTSSTPSSDNAITVRFAEYPIPFGRWVDFVLKFRHNTSGNGLLQVWMDGQQIANYSGSLGYNTGMADYAKFGYYNWSGSAMSSVPRKVLLRAPTIVADPTGQTYNAEQVRTLLSATTAI
jgi:Polysaccharide lyase/Bacterial Ig domain